MHLQYSRMYSGSRLLSEIRRHRLEISFCEGFADFSYVVNTSLPECCIWKSAGKLNAHENVCQLATVLKCFSHLKSSPIPVLSQLFRVSGCTSETSDPISRCKISKCARNDLCGLSGSWHTRVTYTVREPFFTFSSCVWSRSKRIMRDGSIDEFSKDVYGQEPCQTTLTFLVQYRSPWIRSCV